MVAEVSIHIPTKPLSYLPQLGSVSSVGTLLASEVRETDHTYFTGMTKLRAYTESLRLRTEKRDDGSLYSLLQLNITPKVDKLVQKKEKIDVLCLVKVQAGAEKILRWWQGKVTKKLKGNML